MCLYTRTVIKDYISSVNTNFQAVTETKNKTLRIVSDYINKKRVEPFKTEPFVLKTSLGGSTPINNSLSQPDNTVNNKPMQNIQNNSEISNVISSLSRIIGGAEVSETDIQSLIKIPEIFEAYTGNKIKETAETEIRTLLLYLLSRMVKDNIMMLRLNLILLHQCTEKI